MAAEFPEFIDPEDCPERSPRQILAGCGFIPTAPEELDDQQLPGRLWELLYAAAVRRFFFCFSDHVSDRELYILLWEQWLDEQTADIPLEAETNTTTFISEMNTPKFSHDEIWIRFYANEEDRIACSQSDPNEVLPPHQKLPYDRDRFLPTPPIPLEAHSGWLPGDELPLEEEESDPLGLAEIDREIAEAKSEAAGEVPPAEPALEAQLQAMEPDNWTPPAKQLQAENIPLLPPAELTPESLTPILWELLHNLALRGFYVLHTDHLSDQELYTELWERGLRDPAHLPGRNPRGGWFHDFLGSWGDDEMQIWLKYYASDEKRSEHSTEWPNDTLPDKAKPPFNRDWRLPKGPF